MKNLSDDTNLFLAIIYKSFLATPFEREVIKAKEYAIRRKKDQEARKKYNPNNIFNN